ncbi:cutinase family protein [Nocardia sp. NPDC058499]|uniref:cutinase family protein n=1 Tax=Nocardia sp. NPDC058499 TaxID=3346530 RepID=UPI00364F6CA9
MHRVNTSATVAWTLFRAVVVAVGAVMVAAATVSAAPTDSGTLGVRCPHVYVLGVQGGEESSPDAPADSDSGALGQVFGPLLATAGESVQRAYIPYGYNNDGAVVPYEQATAAATEDLHTRAGEVLDRCPDTKIAVAGYAQGAVAVSEFARRIGRGEVRVPADAIAGIALLAHPGRAPHTPVLPGRPGDTRPAAAPGTTGQAVAQISLHNPALSGGGIAAHGPDGGYGSLTGRVADLCVPGDATCDAPVGGTLATTVANIAARSDLRDPIAAISTISQALSATVFTTAVAVVNEDLTGATLDELSYSPQKTIGQRLAEASAPGARVPGPQEALAALLKLGGIGLNAVVTVARTVFTPATIAELATVGMANPWAAVAVLGTKLAGAVVQLVPPHTASRWANEAFDAITTTITDHSELYQVASSAGYSDTVARHGSYNTTAAGVDGSSPLAEVADWFQALATDLAAATPTPPASTAPTATSTAPTATSTAAPSSSTSPPPGRHGGP